MIDELTKSELKICKLLNTTGSFDYSYNQLSNMLNISIPTVWSSLKSLIKKGYIKKIRFFEGQLPRNRYIALEKLNIQTVASINVKTDETVSNNRVTGIEKESCRTTDYFLKSNKPINTISSLDMIDIYNINNIYKSNQSDNTVFLKVCQDEISKKSKKIQVGSENKAEMIDTAISPTLSKFKATDKLNKLIRVIGGENNDNAKKVTHFFKTESKEDKHALIQDVLCNFSRRISNDTHDKIRNIWAYLRTVLVNAVNSFYDTIAMKNECNDVIKATSKLSKDTVIGNMRKPSWHNFEQRQYSDDYFEQFYCSC